MTQDPQACVVEIANVPRRFGYRRIHDLLRLGHPGVNYKGVNRLNSAANLAVSKCKKFRRHASDCAVLRLARTFSEVWSMEFVV